MPLLSQNTPVLTRQMKPTAFCLYLSSQKPGLQAFLTLWVTGGCSFRYPFVQKILPSRIFPKIFRLQCEISYREQKRMCRYLLASMFYMRTIIIVASMVKCVCWIFRLKATNPSTARLKQLAIYCQLTKAFRTSWLQAVVVQGLRSQFEKTHSHFPGPLPVCWLHPKPLWHLMVAWWQWDRLSSSRH